MYVDDLTLDRDVRALLTCAAGAGGIDAYLSGRWQTVGWMHDGRLVSAALLRVESSRVAVLLISTRHDFRGHSHGSSLIRSVAAAFDPLPLVAETDEEAVGFYRRIGAQVVPVDSPWPMQRYRCVLRLPQT